MPKRARRLIPRHKRPATNRRRVARKTANARGYNYAWQQAAAAFLAENPLCVECAKRGVVTAATVVDHKIPHRGNVVVFWDVANWQGLCAHDHNQKTARGE